MLPPWAGEVKGQPRPDLLPTRQAPVGYAQAAAGTRAWNSLGRLSNPLTIVLARTKMRLPAGTVPNSATYSDVMSADPCAGVGHMPMIRNLLHDRTAEPCGGLARNTVF